MRRQRTFLAALFVTLVMLSLLADRDAAEQRVIIGTIVEWRVAESISVSNEQTDPGGVRLALGETVYESDAGAMNPGDRVIVWYRGMAERRPVADKVRLLPATILTSRISGHCS